MQYTLLTESDGAHRDRWCFFVAWQGHVRAWWYRTTSHVFLASPVTHRDVRHWLPLCWLTFSMFDVVSPMLPLWKSATLDLTAVVAACVASLRPVDTLQSDILHATVATFWSVGYTLLMPYEIILENAANFGFAIPAVALVFNWFGFHTLPNLAYVAISEAVCMFVCPSATCGAPFALLVVYMGSFAESRCARVCEELHGKQQAVQNLLDGASNGSCSLSARDSTIVHANAKLAETFGQENMVGVRLVDCVKEADIHRLENLLVHAQTPGVLAPCLVTCSTPHFDFDARIIPYCADASSLNLCIQVLGERRFHDRQRPADDTRIGISAVEATISHPSAWPPDTGATTWLGYSDSTLANSMSSARVGVESGTQTDPEATRSNLPTLPAWMVGRPELQSGSDNDAGSDQTPRSGGRGGRRRRRNVFMFENRPFLSAFEITGEENIKQSLYWYLRHWNPPRLRTRHGCCQFHAVCHAASMTARHMVDTMACRGNWRPYGGWQCIHCQHMNPSSPLPFCDMCGAENPHSDSGENAGEPADAHAHHGMQPP